MLLIGRNNARSPQGFPQIDINPVTILKSIQETNQQVLDLLGEFIHRFIPGKKLEHGEQPAIGDIVLFVGKEAERTRNVKHKYGIIVGTNIDGRHNKVCIKYRNADEAIFREVKRNVKDVILIQGVEDIDFNTKEHFIAAS